MAEKKKGGLINRLIMGSEKSEGYARASLPSNRWELFWDIFKGRFWKLVIVNLLTLVFFIPLFVLFFLRSSLIAGYGAACPFSQCFGVGYQALPSLVGFPEQIIVNVNVMIYLFMPIALIIAALGLSGAAYVIRNMVWTEGIFVANDFWRGIKINIVVVLQSTLFYSIFLFGFFISIRFSEYIIASGTGSTVWMTISMAISYVAIVIFTMMYLWMLAMGGSYKLKFFQLLKNSFLMTFGLIFQNIFFVILMAIPVILILLGSFFQMVGIVFMILFGLSFMLLVWLDYTQWAFDKFIESKREGGKVNRGIYSKVGKGGSQSKAVQEYEANLQAAMSVKSDLSSRPIKPITDDLKVYELPESFSRDDLKKLRESKERIIEDTEKYAEEHQNDEKYVTYNARFEKPAEEEDKKDKKGKKDKKSKKGDEDGDAE